MRTRNVRYSSWARGTAVLVSLIWLTGCQPGTPETSPDSEHAPQAEHAPHADGPSEPVEGTASPEVPESSSAPVPSDSNAATTTSETAMEELAADLQWGNLCGRFVFDGTPPPAKEVTVTSDVAYCGPLHPMDESLIVNAENQGLANVLVLLYQGRDAEAPPVHPSYAKSATDKITIDNCQCCFMPHMVLLRTSQTLEITNTDKISHNTKVDTMVNPPINPTLPAGATLERNFQYAEKIPARVSCSIHPWMGAWLMIRSDPYATKTDRDGRFEIKDLPAGTWTFQVWHERKRFVTEVERDGKPTQWQKGRFTVEIPADGTLDMGDLKVKPDQFR